MKSKSSANETPMRGKRFYLSLGMLSFLTLAPLDATVLNPNIVFVGSSTIHVTWQPLGTTHFTALLGRDASFSVLESSQTGPGNVRVYNFLPNNTEFYFKVKVSSEVNGNYSAYITTRTKDYVYPQLTIHFPSNGSNPSIDSLSTLSGSANDNVGIQRVRIRLKRISDNKYWDFGNQLWQASGIFFDAAGTNNWTMNTAPVQWSPDSYELRAEAEDYTPNITGVVSNFNATASADAVPPTVSIGTPINNNTYTDNQLLTISGSASDNIGLQDLRIRIIRLSDNFEWYGTGVSWNNGLPPQPNVPSGLSNWYYFMPLSAWTQNGSYAILAIAKDTSGNVSTHTINVTLQNGGGGDTTPPSIVTYYPYQGGSFTDNQLTTISGSANDNVSVQDVKIRAIRQSDNLEWSQSNNNWVTSPIPTPNVANGSNSWNFFFPQAAWSQNGNYTMLIIAKDTSNNVSTQTLTFTVQNAGVDATLPTISIFYPYQDGVFTDNQLTSLSGTASDNVALNQVKIRLFRQSDNFEWDPNLVSWVSGVPSNPNLPSGLYYWQNTMPISAWSQNGNYTMMAIAKDSSNNHSTHTITFSIQNAGGGGDTIAPNTNIYFPYQGGVFSPGQLTSLSGSASDNTSIQVIKIRLVRQSDNFEWSDINGNWVTPPGNGILNTASGLYNWYYYMSPSAWTTDGNYTMQTIARDPAGNVSTQTISFTLQTAGGGDTTSPTVFISNPADGSNPPISALMTISGGANDNNALQKIQVRLRRISDSYYWDFLGFYWSPTEKWQDAFGLNSWNVNSGSVYWGLGTYELTAKAIDTSANSSTHTIQFTATADVDTTAPNISVYYPYQSGVFTDTQLTLISGSASDNLSMQDVKIRLIRQSDNYEWSNTSVSWINEATLNIASGLYYWQYTLPISAWTQDGQYTLIAVARDLAGNINNQTIQFTLQRNATVGNDAVPPQIRINHPANNTSHAAEALSTLNGTASDNLQLLDISLIIQNLNTSLYWDGTNFASASEVPFNMGSPSNWYFSGIAYNKWTNGHNYRIIARARDNNYNIGVDTVTVTVTNAAGGTDTIPPVVLVQTPLSGFSYSPTSLTINGTASDNNGLSQVQISLLNLNSGLYYDGIGFTSGVQTFLNSQGSLNYWNFYVPSVAFENANYQLYARAIDNANNTSSTQTVSFSIAGAAAASDTIDPVVYVTIPAGGANYTDPSSLTNISGTASDNVGLNEVAVTIRDDNNKYWNGANWTNDAEYWISPGGSFANWQMTLPYNAWKNGTFLLKARARDTSNRVGIHQINFSVSGLSSTGNADPTPPSNIIYNPLDGSNQSPYSFTYLNGRSDDGFGISEVAVSLRNSNTGLYWNGASFSSPSEWWINPTLTIYSYSVDWNISLPFSAYSNGAYVFRVRSKDPSNNSRITSSSFTVTGAGAGAGDTTPPTASIYHPAHNQTYTAAQLVTISGSAFDSGGEMSSVDLMLTRLSDNFRFNGVSFQSTDYWIPTVGLSNWSMFTSLSMWSDGNYILTVRGRDTAQNETLTTTNFTVSGAGSAGTPPSVLFYSPTNNQTYTPTTITISGSASDDIGPAGISNVKIRITDLNLFQDWNPNNFVWAAGERWIDAVVSGNNWNFSQTVYWPLGRFRITAQAQDTSGLLSLPTSIEINVNNTGSGSDFTAPASITDLKVKPGTTIGSVELTWTAPGDDDRTGTADSYTMKYLPGEPILTEEARTRAYDVAFAPTYLSPPVPLVSGSLQTMNLYNLTPGVAYYFSIRARDEAGNRSGLSNSPVAVAFSGCEAGTGDGQGTASISPSSIQESSSTNVSVVYTVGANGITTGGKISFKTPDTWMYPQTWGSSYSGYVTYTKSNSLATFTMDTNGPVVTLTLQSGTLNAGDTVTLLYKAYPSCGVQSNVKFHVLSQATSCGLLREIASQPTVNVTAGSASWVGFGNEYEKFVTLNQTTEIVIRGQNSCGQAAAVSSNLTMEVSAVKWNNTTYQYDTDPDAQLSQANDMSSPFTTGNVIMTTGNSLKSVFYKLTSNANSGNNRIRVRYTDIQWGGQSENSLSVIPVASGAGLSQISIDTGNTTSGQTQVTLSPDGDGVGDFAFINYTLGFPVSSHIEVSKDDFATITWETWAYGTTVRQSWDGRRYYPYNDVAPAGTYKVRISAGGLTPDTSLLIVLQANGITGVVRDLTTSNPVPNANVNVFGSVYRYTQTDSGGNLNLTGVPNGTYTMKIEKFGYATHETQLTVTGGAQNVGNISIKPLSRVIFDGTRSNTALETWGSLRARGGGEELFSSLRFAFGRTQADEGFTTAKPVLYLKPGIAYQVTAEIPGFSVTPLSITLAEGQISTWTVSLATKKSLSGQVRLTNGILNTTGISINLSAGLDTNSDKKFDSGYPTFFAHAYIPPSEFQANYSFPGMDAGNYLVTAFAPGFTPIESSATITTSADTSLNLSLTQGSQATVHINFSGDSTILDTMNGDPSDGQFPVTLQINSATGFNMSQTIRINTNVTLANSVMTLTGLPNGTYNLYYSRISGFDLNPPGPRQLIVAGGTGAQTLPFAANTGAITGAITLPSGSNMGSVQLTLKKDTEIRTSPTVAGNQFTFPNLDSGIYTLSIIDTVSNGSQILQLNVINGQTTQANIDLTAIIYCNVSGTVRSLAAPPYQSLSNISSNSTDLILNVAGGTIAVPALSVIAYYINPDNTIDPLPTTPGTLWNPAKIKFGSINGTTGLYTIPGLKSGSRYKIRLNPDFNGDGRPDIPLKETIVSLTSNRAGVDFTIEDGGRIQGTITVSESVNSHSLKLILTDTDLKTDVAVSTLSLVGTSVDFSFPNLRIGRYLITVVDLEVPTKYTAKPVFVTLENASEVKTVSLPLSRGAVVRFKLADKSGLLITSSNYTVYLPTGFKPKVISRGHVTEASGPNAEGIWSADILPDVDYELRIEDKTQTLGKTFLPVVRNVKGSVGQYVDLGVILLEKGTSINGVVTDVDDNPIPNVPIYIYQSLARKLDPIKVMTDVLGRFQIELDPRVRFYDLVANLTGKSDSLSTLSQSEKTMMDITKITTDVTFELNAISGSLKGTLLPAGSQTLTAAYGQNEGLPGVTVLITPKGEQKILEFITNPDGTFTVSLPPGRYEPVTFLAKNHKPYTVTSVVINTDQVDLGSLQLTTGVSISGTIRNADGSLPTTDQVSQILFINGTTKGVFKAFAAQESVTGGVDRYEIHGLDPVAHNIVAVDKIGRIKVLKTNFTVPTENTVLNLSFTAGEPRLMASFIQKLPAGVEAIFSCNQPYRNSSEDLDEDGTADDNEFANFVTVTQGNGSLEFTSVDSARQNASYLYTQGAETATSLRLAAAFTTAETNPATGSNYTVQGTFIHPFGLRSQQEEEVSNVIGGQLSLPGGSSISIPENALVGTDSVLMGFKAADGLDTFVSQVELSSTKRTSGAQALALARTLGASSYPPNMYRAIKALADVPDVNPFSSFYDIFLPAGVARLFSNKPTLTLTYDEGADPAAINIYYFNEAQGVYTIENNDRRVDTVNRTISVSIGHASIFTVLASSASIIQGDSFSGSLEVFNFPNPFDLQPKTVTLQHPGSASASQSIQGTMIKFSLPDGVSGAVEIEIFDVAGDLVRTLHTTATTAGTHNYLEWDGRNDHGQEVASGVYIGRFEIANGNEKFFKMAVIK